MPTLRSYADQLFTHIYLRFNPADEDSYGAHGAFEKAAAASKFDFESGLTFEHFGWSIMEVRAGSVAQTRVARRAR